MESRACLIRSLASLGAGHYWLEVQYSLRETIQPGQFVQVKIDDGMFLRRPFSIARITEETIGILFRVVGRGTSLLSRRKPGDSIDIIGPLGHGFPEVSPGGSAWLVAGGTGVAPLLAVADRLREQNRNVHFFYGAKSVGCLFPSLLPAGTFPVTLCTDDGSRGYHGTVVSAVEKSLIETKPPDVIFANGPKAMLRGLAASISVGNIPCWVSLENRMACGLGMCFGCVAAVRVGGIVQQVRICRDGPVFRAQDVVWD